LNLRQRQVLIMIDGKRSQDDLEKHLNHLDVAEIVADLKKLGYIHDPTTPVAKADVTATPTLAPLDQVAPLAQPVFTEAAVLAMAQPAQESTIDPEQATVLKDILLSSAKEYLGIMGQSITQKIEAAQSLEQLKACVSQWHMAIRESKLGKPVAGVLMEQVQQMLAN
jgi:hypothetical protein